MQISRRGFLKYCIGSAAALGLPLSVVGKLEEALGAVTDGLPKVVWLAGANCTGCTVSLANRISSEGPTDLADLLTGYIDLAYHPNLMGAAGDLAVQRLHEATSEDFILVVEGGIPTAFGGHTCMLWTENGVDVTAQAAVQDLSARAAAVLSIGTCASHGGIPAGNPNPTGIVSVSELTGLQTINIPGCPAHPDWITQILVALATGRTADIALDDLDLDAMLDQLRAAGVAGEVGEQTRGVDVGADGDAAAHVADDQVEVAVERLVLLGVTARRGDLVQRVADGLAADGLHPRNLHPLRHLVHHHRIDDVGGDAVPPHQVAGDQRAEVRGEVDHGFLALASADAVNALLLRHFGEKGGVRPAKYREHARYFGLEPPVDVQVVALLPGRPGAAGHHLPVGDDAAAQRRAEVHLRDMTDQNRHVVGVDADEVGDDLLAHAVDGVAEGPRQDEAQGHRHEDVGLGEPPHQIEHDDRRELKHATSTGGTRRTSLRASPVRPPSP